MRWNPDHSGRAYMTLSHFQLLELAAESAGVCAGAQRNSSQVISGTLPLF